MPDIDSHNFGEELGILRRMAKFLIERCDGLGSHGTIDSKDFLISVSFTWNTALIEQVTQSGETLEAMRSLHRKGVSFAEVLHKSVEIFKEEQKNIMGNDKGSQPISFN